MVRNKPFLSSQIGFDYKLNFKNHNPTSLIIISDDSNLVLPLERRRAVCHQRCSAAAVRVSARRAAGGAADGRL